MKITGRTIRGVLLVIALAGPAICSAPAAGDDAALRARANQEFGPLPSKMPGSEADTPAMVKLGKKLFSDKRLSVTRTISCSSCHDVNAKGGAYDRSGVQGVTGAPEDRDPPTVMNAGFQFAQFWDGRAPDLVAQAREPMVNTNEMGMPTEAELVRRLGKVKSYRTKFTEAYPQSSEPISIDHLAQAIAAYEHTLITHDWFDDFLKGDDRALSRSEKRGLGVFMTVGCDNCHDGPLLGGNSFQKIGVKHPYQYTGDLGRARITGRAADQHVFKVPSLRNVELTAPYFHDGSVATLDQAVRQMAWLQLDRKLTQADAHSIVLFLRTLSDKYGGRLASVRPQFTQ